MACSPQHDLRWICRSRFLGSSLMVAIYQRRQLLWGGHLAPKPILYLQVSCETKASFRRVAVGIPRSCVTREAALFNAMCTCGCYCSSDHFVVESCVGLRLFLEYFLVLLDPGRMWILEMSRNE